MPPDPRRTWDASGHVADDPVGITACTGATWIGHGVAGTVELLRRSLVPGGMMLIGEPYRRRKAEDQAAVEGCHMARKDDLRAHQEGIREAEGHQAPQRPQKRPRR